jgi:hypothetical protein
MWWWWGQIIHMITFCISTLTLSLFLEKIKEKNFSEYVFVQI